MIIFTSQKKPNYLFWWLIYQGVFIIASSGIVILFIRLKDERHGLLSYFKNYLVQIVITTFIAIFIFSVVLLIYFWLSVLSLLSYLKKDNRKKIGELSMTNREDLPENFKTLSSSQAQLIPLKMMQSSNSEGNALNENGKFFILHLWSVIKIIKVNRQF